MSRKELEKYAETLITMSTDFLLGKIDKDHYSQMIEIFNQAINKNELENDRSTVQSEG